MSNNVWKAKTRLQYRHAFVLSALVDIIPQLSLLHNVCLYAQMCQTGFEFAIKRILYFSGSRTTVDVTDCVACDWSVSILAGYLN